MLKPALVLVNLALTSATQFAYKSAAGAYSSIDPESGWRTLSVTTSDPKASPREAAFDAGFVEGHLTCAEITQFFDNFYVFTFGEDSQPNDDIVNFVNENDAFVESMVDTDLYWSHVGDIYARSAGMLKGYNESPCSKQSDFKPLSKLDWNLLQMDGDLFDLMTAYPDKQTLFEQAWNLITSPFTSFTSTDKVFRCSALIKLTEDDLFFGHDTWDTYSTASPRIYKTITLPVHTKDGPRLHVDSFSSSPGFIASIDDYYTVDGTSSLIVIETSNNVYDDSAYDALTPKSVFCWARTMVANQMGVDGESWSKAFSTFHSGTYNNQWLIVDRERFDTDEGLLWIVEEAPGLMHSEDMTKKLRSDGYWGSYNVAYYDDIRAVMGETEGYWEAPRANLFAEMQSSVKDMHSMTYVMGWNDYLNDPNSEGKPSNAIMARDDLLRTPRAAGGIDSKASSINTLKTVGTLARVGPTYGGEGVDAFCWSGVPVLEKTTVHEGHPDCFDFVYAPVGAKM
ncbi:hypothetical protein TrST_g1913 [Triparma strigata]|uniref:Phospholipase B-like n=1 Tax=Triparma strigata TaxID=1606541 RepID=A0A9W7ECH0_9STRA|nr:hypothetical protein TrST_g1913 [Triparma strigata]